MAGVQEWSNSGSVRGEQVLHVENMAQARSENRSECLGGRRRCMTGGEVGPTRNPKCLSFTLALARDYK